MRKAEEEEFTAQCEQVTGTRPVVACSTNRQSVLLLIEVMPKNTIFWVPIFPFKGQSLLLETAVIIKPMQFAVNLSLYPKNWL